MFNYLFINNMNVFDLPTELLEQITNDNKLYIHVKFVNKKFSTNTCQYTKGSIYILPDDNILSITNHKLLMLYPPYYIIPTYNDRHFKVSDMLIGTRYDILDKKTLILFAILHKYTCVIKYMHRNYNIIDNDFLKQSIISGDMKILKFYHKIGCKFDENMMNFTTVEYNNIKAIKYIMNNTDIPLCPIMYSTATQYDNIRIMKFLYKHKYPWNKSIYTISMQCNSSNCLKYAIKHGCPLHNLTYDSAALHNRLSLFKYIYEYPGSSLPNYDSRNIVVENVCHYANENKNIEFLIYAYINGFPCSDRIIGLHNLTQYKKLTK